MGIIFLRAKGKEGIMMGIKLSNDRRDYNLNVNYILRAGGTLTEGIII